MGFPHRSARSPGLVCQGMSTIEIAADSGNLNEHGAGSSEVDLRQGRCPKPPRACRPDPARSLCAACARRTIHRSIGILLVTSPHWAATDRSVSRIGLGLAAIGRPAYITTNRGADLGADRSVETLRGADLADCSTPRTRPASATSTSRARMVRPKHFSADGSRAANGVDDLVVGSKWGYTYVGGWDLAAPVQEVKDLSLATFERQYARDACAARRPPPPLPGALADHRVRERWRTRPLLAALARRRREGLLLGITTTGPKQADTIRRALEVRVDGRAAVLVGAGDLEPPRAVGRAGA